MNEHLVASGIEPLESGHIEAVETDYDCIEIILLDGELVGMIKTVRDSDPWHLRQIQIHPSFQGAGIGTRVMEKLLKEAKTSSCSIVLNVLHVNPARRLYKRLGFKTVESNDRADKMQWTA